MQLEVIEEHFRKNYQRIMKRMTFRAGEQWTAEDIVQTAYERAIRYRESCDERGIGAWFERILSNAFNDYKNDVPEHDRLPSDYEETPDTYVADFAQIRKEVFELIDTKSPHQAEVLRMHFRYGYSPTDIHRLTVYPYITCYRIINRFKEELRQLYKD